MKKSDLVDACLFTDMLLYAMDIRPPGNILFITGDPNFANSISELKKRGFTMLLAHLEDADAKLIDSAKCPLVLEGDDRWKRTSRLVFWLYCFCLSRQMIVCFWLYLNLVYLVN